jgi:hypothetical protein
MLNQAVQKTMTNKQTSLLQLVKILETNRKHIILNFQHLQENYQHQHIRQIPGTRDLDGKLIQPWLVTQDVDRNEYVQISSFALNRYNASLNMLIQRQVRLVKAEDETPVIEVAGLLTNQLNRFNSYTIVSNGQINIREIKVKISSQKAFYSLYHAGVFADTEFDFRKEYIIHLDELPLVDLKQNYTSLDGVFKQLAETKIMSSILSACLREESDIYLPEQLEILSQHHLSKNVYLNFPYTKQCNENINTKTTHHIDIGSKDILNLNQLYSANKFLNRMYRAYDVETGEIFQKAHLGMIMSSNIAFRHKLISSRIKITAIDEFMKPIFDDFLGLADNGIVSAILTRVGVNLLPQNKCQGKHVNKLEMVAALTAANTMLGQYRESIYREKISPLVFYIGSTGLLPENIQTPAMNAQEVALKYPKLKFSVIEKAGQFFEIGDNIIGIYSKTELYSQKNTVESPKLR